MKTKFSDFINENKSKKTFEEYISNIKKNLMTDFRYNESQAQVYIEQYIDLFKKFFDDNFDPKEAIAATKIPGVKIDESINESYDYIDNDIDKLTNLISNIKNKNDLAIASRSIKEYFNDYYNKSYSDIRIFERVKNNYKKMMKMYKQKFKQII